MDIWVLWKVYRDGNVKAYKQFESVPSPTMKHQMYFFFVLAILSICNFAYSLFTMDVYGALLSLVLCVFSLYITLQSETQNK